MLGRNGAPGVEGPIEQIRPIATLQVLGALPGGSVQVSLAGAPNEIFVLVVGSPGTPIPIPELGGSLAVTGFWFVAAGVFATTPFQLSVPASFGMPPGTVLCWQAVAGDGVAAWQLSDPATYVRTR